MPSQSSKHRPPPNKFRQLTGPVVLVFLLIVAATLFIDYWQTRHSVPFPRPAQTSTRPAPEAEASAAAVYFSAPLSRMRTGGPDEQLAEAIQGAQKSVDMAVYNISLENVASALTAAAQRGVTVRLVMESEAMDGKQVRRLLAAGIPIEGDQRESLMHNKFTIIDGIEVWTGSMNYTASAAYDDFNDLVRIRSKQIAQNYTAEFEEMFTEGLFGDNTKPATPNPQVNLDGMVIETYFSPDDGAAPQIISEIRQARSSIDFLAYSFTSDDIAAAIFERAAAGVSVRGVFDADQVESNTGGEYAAFKESGYDVRLDGIPGLMHHKVILIDQQVVITGSYNFSRSAERFNDENIIIIHSPAMAALYQEQFEIVYQNGK